MIKNMTKEVTADLFSDEERQILNQMCDQAGYHISREDVISLVDDMRTLVGDDDQDMRDLVDGLRSKLAGLIAEEWDELSGLMPFSVNLAATETFIDVQDGEDFPADGE